MFKRGSAHRDVRPDKGVPLNNLADCLAVSRNKGLDVRLVARDLFITFLLWTELKPIIVHYAVLWGG